MKKIFLIAVLASIFTCAAFAQNQDLSHPKDESKWSDISYVTAPVLKVLEAKEYYVVIYQKKYAGTASVVIPKSWTTFSKEQPRKLKFRNITNPDASFITVVKKADNFHRVILTIPMKKNNKLWGVVTSDKKIDNIDKDTLEELDI
ncbi:MAG: hypothetical protein K5907_08010 [Treponema sp.]|nr:hypothetical protein [Treponema sp.]